VLEHAQRESPENHLQESSSPADSQGTPSSPVSSISDGNAVAKAIDSPSVQAPQLPVGLSQAEMYQRLLTKLEATQAMLLSLQQSGVVDQNGVAASQVSALTQEVTAFVTISEEEVTKQLAESSGMAYVPEEEDQAGAMTKASGMAIVPEEESKALPDVASEPATTADAEISAPDEPMDLPSDLPSPSATIDKPNEVASENEDTAGNALGTPSEAFEESKPTESTFEDELDLDNGRIAQFDAWEKSNETTMESSGLATEADTDGCAPESSLQTHEVGKPANNTPKDNRAGRNEQAAQLSTRQEQRQLMRDAKAATARSLGGKSTPRTTQWPHKVELSERITHLINEWQADPAADSLPDLYIDGVEDLIDQFSETDAMSRALRTQELRKQLDQWTYALDMIKKWRSLSKFFTPKALEVLSRSYTAYQLAAPDSCRKKKLYEKLEKRMRNMHKCFDKVLDSAKIHRTTFPDLWNSARGVQMMEYFDYVPGFMGSSLKDLGMTLS
jgi:hypothetical protein